MSRTLLVNAVELEALLGEDGCLPIDCRFDLSAPGAGRRAWRAGHVPGAVHADLDQDLAGPVTPTSGRHPLPRPEDFSDFLARAGWRAGRRIVAYDAQGGAFAARLWWLMRYFGHDVVSLLDGGWAAWKAAGGAVEVGEPTVLVAAPVTLSPDPSTIVSTQRVAEQLETGELLVLDARDAERFAGRSEPIDPVAGHIPGARNRPFARNLEDGRFRDPGALRREFDATIGATPSRRVVHQCGSGVTACHNQFAMELAGLRGSRLYAGSWSEWIRDPSHPVDRGEERTSGTEGD